MKESKIILKNGNPCLCIGDEELSACAYMTYFDERNDYEMFSKRGFRIYSVSVSLAAQPINAESGFMPFEGGVFDVKGKPDFSKVDKAVNLILENCPDAYIFPRIYVCMPQWWIDENYAETIEVPHNKRRESLYSYKFRKDAGEMLKQLIEHFKSFEASEHIFGYQISGGNTQEWFHLDLKGGYSPETLPFFNNYLEYNRPDIPEVSELPDIYKIDESEFLNDKTLTAFLRFASREVAETVDYLCKITKEAVDYKQIVGVFYGYTAELPHQLWGSHALEKIIDSPYIDFFSSPNSYINNREFGIDWGDMMPVNSIKLHGKMCFIECDIRTFLTKSPGQSRAGSDPLGFYTSDVWKGPETEELSVWAVRKSIARQLTHKHGLWHFDMFGHWFSSRMLADELENSLKLYNESVKTKPFEYPSEVAVIYDEKSFSYIGKLHPAYSSVYNMRTALGACGTSYDVYLSSDINKIDWEKSSYKAVIFVIPYDNGFVEDFMIFFKTIGIASISISYDKPLYTLSELTVFLKKNGVHIYSESGDVFYQGNGYVAIHAKEKGMKKITLPQIMKYIDLSNGNTAVSDSIMFECSEFETRLFKCECVNINKEVLDE